MFKKKLLIAALFTSLSIISFKLNSLSLMNDTDVNLRYEVYTAAKAGEKGVARHRSAQGSIPAGTGADLNIDETQRNVLHIIR